MKTIGILQPSYLPWLGYFDYIDQCDVFVFLDTVQYDKDGWRNRNKIKTKDGWQWLTVPVKTAGRFGQLIKDVEIDNTQDWREKHLKAIKQNYTGAKCFDWSRGESFREELFTWYTKMNVSQEGFDCNILQDLVVGQILWFCAVLGVGYEWKESLRIYYGKKQFARSYEMVLNHGIDDPDRNIRLLKICQYHKADRYLATQASRCYLDVGLFEKNGIRVDFQDYKHPVYPQLHGEFISHLSIIDLLFNCGPESLNIIRSTRQ